MTTKTPRTTLMLMVLMAAMTAPAATVYKTTSAHNHIAVEDKDGYRILSFNGSMETRLLMRNHLQGHFEYTEYFQMPLLWNPKAKRVLMVGLGGGSTQRAFAHYYPDITVDTVELDPAVSKVAQDYFAVKVTPKHQIHHQDGRVFLRRNTQVRYDAIVLDAYTSNRYGSFIPFHLATKEFFQLAKEDLTPNGVLAYNVIGNYQGWRADIVGSMYRTMKTVFPHVYHFPASDSKNIVMIAAKQARPLNSRTLRDYMTTMRRDRPKVSPTFWVRVLALRDKPPPSAERSPILTDNYTPVGGLLTSGGR